LPASRFLLELHPRDKGILKKVFKEVFACLFLHHDTFQHKLLALGDIAATEKLLLLSFKFLLFLSEVCLRILDYDGNDILVVGEGKDSIGLTLGLTQ
jgi:hypothetical protein